MKKKCQAVKGSSGMKPCGNDADVVLPIVTDWHQYQQYPKPLKKIPRIVFVHLCEKHH